MGFGEAVRTCFAKYVDFTGRAPRSEFWWFFLFATVGSLITSMLDTMVGFSLLNAVFPLALLLPNLAVTARRLHDRDMSGWWMLAPYGAMALAGIMAGIGAGILAVASGIGAAVLVILLLVWLIQKGTDGPNRFGADPLDGSWPEAPAPGGYTPSRMPRVERDDD